MSTAPAILYVEDDAGLRRLAQRALERRGFAVETAADADSALRRLDEAAFDLVAVDHHMPGKSGLELLADIVARPAPPPVVFVTGTAETQVAISALKSGAADFVVKAVGDDFFDLLARSFTQALDNVALQRAKEAMAVELQEANARLEALLGEVHHRVANSLQMVSSFVTLQARRTEDAAAKDALRETQGRIQAVMQVHHRLYASQSSDTVALDGYLETLVDGLRDSVVNARPGLSLALDAQPVTVRPDQAVSIGVIVTELVSNAAKYAYPDDSGGVISVVLRPGVEGGFAVEVKDDGCGFAPGGEAQGTGLGMTIVTAMARSLRCELEHVPQDSGSLLRLTVAG